jgi:hypothetical protein
LCINCGCYESYDEIPEDEDDDEVWPTLKIEDLSGEFKAYLCKEHLQTGPDGKTFPWLNTEEIYYDSFEKVQQRVKHWPLYFDSTRYSNEPNDVVHYDPLMVAAKLLLRALSTESTEQCP